MKAVTSMVRHPSRTREILVNLNKIVVHKDEARPLVPKPVHISHTNKILVITTQYPREDAAYRNMFVHRRTKLYEKLGVGADVFSFCPRDYITEYEFEGVRVYEGDWDTLGSLLKATDYDMALIHFVEPGVMEALDACSREIQRCIWLHGAGAERWRRRSFEYTPQEIENRQNELDAADEELMEFNRAVYSDQRNHMVVVSNYLAALAAEDAGCEIANLHVIHNVIDGDLFAYQEKDPDTRKKVLSIRPYVGRKYANDLTVETILALSKESWFDEMTFTLFGDGAGFDELTEPLRSYSNVTLHKRFLTQPEIAEQHKLHGVMLIPTRHDTQGVAMGEAMASGLVPITNAVWAIPEFVDKDCAMLAPDEDVAALAEGIVSLYHDVGRFQELSVNAAERVRTQCGIEETIRKEIELFTGLRKSART